MRVLSRAAMATMALLFVATAPVTSEPNNSIIEEYSYRSICRDTSHLSVSLSYVETSVTELEQPARPILDEHICLSGNVTVLPPSQLHKRLVELNSRLEKISERLKKYVKATRSNPAGGKG